MHMGNFVQEPQSAVRVASYEYRHARGISSSFLEPVDLENLATGARSYSSECSPWAPSVVVVKENQERTVEHPKIQSPFSWSTACA